MSEDKNISNTTIEALTRNFFKEAESYGFKYEHYLKFVNMLLDMALQPNSNNTELKNKTVVQNNKVSKLPIKTERLIIRPFDKKNDLHLFKEWLKDEYGRYFILTLTSNRKFTAEELINSDNNIFGMITLHDETPIGVMGFLNYDRDIGKAELRKIIGVANLRGKGYGKEATIAWIEYGRLVLKLKKIFLNTIDTNIHNIKINEDLGFKVEGIFRNEIMIDNKFHDVLRMGLLFP